MQFEPHITIGNILEVLVILGGILAYLRASSSRTGHDSTVLETMQVEITLLRRATEQLTTLTAVSAERLNLHEKLLDDLRRGEGYILPFHLGKKPSS